MAIQGMRLREVSSPLTQASVLSEVSEEGLALRFMISTASTATPRGNSDVGVACIHIVWSHIWSCKAKGRDSHKYSLGRNMFIDLTVWSIMCCLAEYNGQRLLVCSLLEICLFIARPWIFNPPGCISGKRLKGCNLKIALMVFRPNLHSRGSN